MKRNIQQLDQEDNTSTVDRISSKLTVVILTYNSGKTLGACLDSLREQTNKLFKIIIIDDNSIDNTIEVINSYKRNGDLDIGLSCNGSRNIPKGRNIGIRLSRTDLVSFLDSDDCAEERWAQTIVDTFHKNPGVGLLSGSITFFGRSTCANAIAAIDDTTRRLFGKGVISFAVGNSAFNKKILGIDFLFDENFKYAEDVEISSRINKHGYKILFVPTMRVYQSSRDSFVAYAKQMYVYGMWRIYSGVATGDYRPLDFVPLVLMLFSIFSAVALSSTLPLLAIVFFSLLEALFVVSLARPTPVVAALTFPAWIFKNVAWSVGIAAAGINLVRNRTLRVFLLEKRRQSRTTIA